MVQIGQIPKPQNGVRLTLGNFEHSLPAMKIPGRGKKKRTQITPGARQKAASNRVIDTAGVTYLRSNPQLAAAIAIKRLGHIELIEGNNPMSQLKDKFQEALLNHAIANIEANSSIMDEAAKAKTYEILGMTPPAVGQGELEDGEGYGYGNGPPSLLEQIRDAKELMEEIGGGNGQQSGLSSLITPEVATGVMTFVTDLISANKEAKAVAGGGGQRDPAPEGYLLETPGGGIVRLTEAQFQDRMRQEQRRLSEGRRPTPEEIAASSPSQTPPSVTEPAPTNQASLPEGTHLGGLRMVGPGETQGPPSVHTVRYANEDTPAGMEPSSFPNIVPVGDDAPVGMEPSFPPEAVTEPEAYVPVSLDITEWIKWTEEPAEAFVAQTAVKAAGGDAQAQGALDFFNAWTVEQIVALLQAQLEGQEDQSVVEAIGILVENQGWLQSVVDCVRQQVRGVAAEEE